MGRLTEKQSAGYDLKALNSEWCNQYCDKQKIETCNECGIYEAIQKLAEYEDLEEQGLLLRLPCKIGESLWFLKDYELTCGKIINIIINNDGLYAGVVEYDDKDEFDEWCVALVQIGKTVFLTKEEAELYLDNQE